MNSWFLGITGYHRSPEYVTAGRFPEIGSDELRSVEISPASDFPSPKYYQFESSHTPLPSFPFPLLQFLDLHSSSGD